jgi:DNA replication and repair protein RecF
VFVDHLQLADFRSYRSCDVALGDGVTTFVGANGHGKTNLVEAIGYLATLGSHRASSDTPLVRAGAEQALIRARVRAGKEDTRTVQLEVEINAGRANRAKVNRSPLQRPRELVGVLRTVIFAPEDLTIVTGDPVQRRRFIDELIIARWPRLAGVKAEYDRVLRQRNALLKSLAGQRSSAVDAAAATLDTWDEHLAAAGGHLWWARHQTLAELVPHAAAAYAAIAPANSVVQASYQTRVDLDEPAAGDPDRPADGESAPERASVAAERLASRLRAEMQHRRTEEIRRGISLVGPHRDDIALWLGELPARGYASHGESWSLTLALRLGSFDLLRADGIEPVLVLDDVFAELDATRRDRLARHARQAEQMLITAAVADDIPDSLAGRRYWVADGAVTADEPAPSGSAAG